MEEPEKIIFPFRVANISMLNTNLPKAHYWDYFNFNGLNKSLDNYCSPVTHELSLPVMPMNSQPIQIQLFLKSISQEEVRVSIKREKMCNCEAVQTQIGINKYKKIYHCPHRLLLTISPDLFVIYPNELAELVMNITFGTNGDNSLRFEIRTSDGCLLYLNFSIQIVLFDLTKCILTRTLSPVRMDDFDCMVQPVWIHNPFAESLNFEFDSVTPNLQVLTHRVFVERGTIAPLFVKFRPAIAESTMTIKIPNFMSSQNTFTLTNSGVVGKDIDINSFCPKSDIQSEYIPFMLSESLLTLHMRRYSTEWRHIEIINNSEICAEFRWLPYNSPPNYASYSVNSFVEITIYPEIVIVGPKSRVKCSIHLAAKEHKCILRTIPIFCEIHRPLTDSMKVARREVSDIESVDEMRYFTCTRITSLFLTFDIVIEKFPKFPIFDKTAVQNLFSSTEIQTEQKPFRLCEENTTESLERKLDSELIGEETEQDVKLDKAFEQVEFEKILWEFIFSNSFLNLMGPLKTNFYD
ncbi:hypothetical protein ACFFRR_011668 [Megaselia abdita]